MPSEAEQPGRARSLLIHMEDIDAFTAVREVPPETISSAVLDTIRDLDEREELEPFLRSILFDTSDTPHGPAEIVDILTHRVTVARRSGIAGFILKGKSFPTVRQSHVAHQIYRLEKIAGLRFAVFAASGTILDSAKEQFCSTAERLGCQYALLDAGDLGRLFVAYGFVCPRDGRRTSAGRCFCGYSPSIRVLNDLQAESLKALSEARRLGQRAGLVVLPPGSGKTRVAAEDAKRTGAARILYVGHSHEMLDVAQSEFEAVFGKARVRRHYTRGTLSSPRLANLATIQLLRRYPGLVDRGQYGYVIVDEFHHAAARSYRQLVERLVPAFLLGLTATPFRTDRQDIISLCSGNVVVNFELRTGIEYGILVPYHYFGSFDDVDYSGIRHNGKRYDVRDLERSLIVPARDEAIVRKWKDKAAGKATLAFCCSHRHAERVAGSFQAAGIPAATYLATTAAADRRSRVARLADGALKVLCVVDVLNEGADIPFVECLLFLRPTESRILFYQQLGRGLRRSVGKPYCTVIDFIGNFKNAYKIVDYHDLSPQPEEEAPNAFRLARNPKEILNLPLGCEVHFDDRVIDVFAQQTLDPRLATRHNIGRILVYQYRGLAKRLQRRPTRADVNRNLLLGSDIYALAFGTWRKFEAMMALTPLLTD